MKLHEPTFEHSCYVIAEIGVNHNGSVEMAKDLIDSAAAGGADAVKFQTFFADDLVSRTAAKAAYQERNTGEAGSQYEMLKRLELAEDDFKTLLQYCRHAGIDFLSTPFGFAAADLLERIGVTGFKVSSGDLTYVQFLEHLARKGLPMIISTGMATLAEVEAAVETIDRTGAVPVSILHCVSDYPAAPELCNLRAMDTMRSAFGRPVGWSDHTVGTTTGIAAVARGAEIIEKHITLDCTLPGPDHAASMEPSDFGAYVQAIRQTGLALGDGIKRPVAAERDTALVARRSVVATSDLPSGHIVTDGDVAILRPGSGLPPELLDLVIGSRLGRAVAGGAPILPADLHHQARPDADNA